MEIQVVKISRQDTETVLFYFSRFTLFISVLLPSPPQKFSFLPFSPPHYLMYMYKMIAMIAIMRSLMYRAFLVSNSNNRLTALYLLGNIRFKANTREAEHDKFIGTLS